MTSDKTQHQSSKEQERARELSLESTQPPSQIPGYKLQRFIGSGAYGEVWAATNLKTGRRVAVKFFTRRSEAGVKQLMREVEKLLAVTSDARYIVQLFDYGWDADPPYYVMDYIESGSLEDRLRTGPLPTSEAIELFQEVATGMMHLHGKGILHCDLKPGNVLLDQDGNPRVADFGQSRMKSDQTSALGTLFYMAPEQADIDAAPDTGWDVYGLGALMYSMLTGKPPYYTPELAAQIEATVGIEERLAKYRQSIKASEKPTDHRQAPGVDRMLADIVDRCIAPNPKNRFKSVQSVLFALRQRELAKTRRPLMVLGILLPLLLMGVVSLFAWSAFTKAIDQTETAVIEKAKQTGEYAAQLAASSASQQIDEHFRAVRDLAEDKNFLDDFEAFLKDEEALKIRIAIANPSKNAVEGVESDPELWNLREKLRQNPLRQKLQAYLEPRMMERSEYPIAASWFVTDRFGNQVASDFGKVLDAQTEKMVPVANRTLGNNYAYRSYFTGTIDEPGVPANSSLGLATDLPLDHPSLKESDSIEFLSQRQIIDSPHLSAAFNSRQTFKWKIAFSVPIRSREKEDEVIGVVAITVDLGSLLKFRHERSFYTMLVDGRLGKYEGIILEHPLYNDEDVLLAEGSNGRLPDELFNGIFVDLDAMVDDEFAGKLFEDPVGQTNSGKKYQVASIVSNFPVMISTRLKNLEQPGDDQPAFKPAPKESERKDQFENTEHSGLYVLAVQDHNKLMFDVQQLGSQLGQLALLALLTMLALGLAMWWFVNRLMRESRERLARTFSPSSDSSSASSIQEMNTLEADDSQKTTAYENVAKK